jgi:PhnB protein
MRCQEEITTMAVSKIPVGYHTLTPYLTVKDGNRAMKFYEQALGAKETMRFAGPEGRIMHAEMKIGDSPFMLSEEFPEMGVKSPESLGGTTGSIMIYIENVDEAYPRAIKAGGKELRPLQDQFYGDRSGTFEDPEGHKWTISTHIEDVSEEEMGRRMAAMNK